MMDIKIRDLLPAFLLSDRNGRALAKALERAFHMAEAAIQEGLDRLQDISKMPEWRLDEMAWAYDLLYNYDAIIEAKRDWVRRATLMRRIYGTPEAIAQYLRSVLGTVAVEEWWAYGAEPYHFRVRTPDVNAASEFGPFIQQVVERTKNLRSVYDGVLAEADIPSAQLYLGFVTAGAEIIIIPGGAP